MQNSVYIIATPIGNREDITIRALKTLESIEYIYAEDTRVVSKLLEYHSIKNKKIFSINEYSSEEKINYILDEAIKNNRDIAFVSDAGTPAISDPGAVLVDMAREKDMKIIPIGGISALTTALSVAGIRKTPFYFHGFLPHKNGRKKILDNLISIHETIVLYESPHRFLKLCEELEKYSEYIEIIVCRELTKIYEEIKKGNIKDIHDFYKENKDKVKGEFVIIISKI